MSRKYPFILTSFLQLSFNFILIETFFRLLSFPSLFGLSFFRIELFTLSISIVLSVICSIFGNHVGKFLVNLFCWAFAVYAITQLQFMNFYGSYMSVKASFDGAGRISEFVGQFISLIDPIYYLALIPPLITTLLSYRIEYTEGKNMLPAAVALIAVVILELAGHFTLVNTPYASLYNYPRFIDRSIREFGLSRFLIQDFRSIHSDETTLLVPESSADPVESTDSPESAESEDTRRNHISDASWEEIMNADDNADRKKIDQYLMSRTMTEYNDHTGMFQDYNVVYVMIEAFDYMAIDPELTPTLYKMKEEGWDFTHHYTPKFSCATGESEFVSEISLVPMSDVCTPNQWATNDWQNSIFNLFEHAGYYTSAYHNWIDEYYDRRILYSHSGCEAYLNYDDLNYTRLWGWQSDLEMMELTIPYWINQDRFFSLYVTTSTHFPYDQGSELGNRYLNEVSAVHPDYPLLVQRYISKAIELDKSMEYLLKQLEDAGKLDHTLIVLFADHHPLETPLQILADYGGQEADRLNGFDEDRTPMIFYTPSMTPTKQDRINSTFDILPTVANLIGLDYEPRIYVGHDYFDPESKLVIFPNGSWITENGSYYASDDTHDDTLSEEEIESRNLEVQNLFTISRMIYDSDYFHFRPTVPFPGER